MVHEMNSAWFNAFLNKTIVPNVPDRAVEDDNVSFVGTFYDFGIDTFALKLLSDRYDVYVMDDDIKEPHVYVTGDINNKDFSAIISLEEPKYCKETKSDFEKQQIYMFDFFMHDIDRHKSDNITNYEWAIDMWDDRHPDRPVIRKYNENKIIIPEYGKLLR